MNKNTMWVVVVVVIVAAGLFFMYGSAPQTITSPSGEILPRGGTQSMVDTATDNPDLIVDTILAGAQVSPTPAEADPSLIAPDSDITSGFDQAANTNSF